MIRLPIGDYIEILVDWLTHNLAGFFNVIREVLLAIISGFEWVFTTIPALVLIIIIALIAWKLANKGNRAIYYNRSIPDSIDKPFGMKTMLTLGFGINGYPYRIDHRYSFRNMDVEKSNLE